MREASLTPSEGSAKVMILEEFHLLAAAGAARLLKTIEEPPDSTTFVILADFVPNDLVTISSGDRVPKVHARQLRHARVASLSPFRAP